MYLVTRTGPDLGCPLSYLPRFSSQLLERNHTAVKRVFRYLPVTLSMSVNYKRSATLLTLSIVAVSDSDYASYRNTRRSVSGYTSMLKSSAISWLFKR